MLAASILCLAIVGSGFSAATASATTVQDVSPVTLSTNAGGVEHVRYSVGFKATTAVSAGGTIRIAAPAGTVLPNGAQVRNETTNQSAFRGGTLSDGNATVTLNVGSSGIAAGDLITVTLSDVKNAATGGMYTIKLSTSSDVDQVDTPAYALTAPQQVSEVTPVTLTTSAGGVQHVRYTVGFTASSTGGVVGNGTITVTAPAGTTLPNGAQIRNETTNTTAFHGGTLTNGNTTLAITVGGTEIGPGDVVTLTLFDVTNAAPGSGYKLDLSTSSDPAPVSSPTYDLTAQQQVSGVTTVTRTTSAAGAQHVRYTVGFTASSTGGVVGNGTITITAPAGTTLPSGAEIHNTTTNTTAFHGGTLTNGNTTLAVTVGGTEIGPNDVVTLTLFDVTNAPAGGGYKLDLSTSSDPTPVSSPTYSLTAPQQVSNVTAVTRTTSAGGVNHVRYTVGFTASSSGGVVGNGTITVTAPTGTTLPSGAEIRNENSNTTAFHGGTLSNGNRTLAVTVGGTEIGPGDVVTLTLFDVTNAPAGGGYKLDLSTSSDPTPVSSPTYSLTAPQQVGSVTPVTRTTNAGGVEHVRYTAGFTASSSGGVVGNGTITITAPAGTTLPSGAQIHNATTNTTAFHGGSLSNGNATLAITVGGTEIGPGDDVTLTISDVTNPPAGSNYKLDLSTSSDPAPVSSPTYSLTAPQAITDVTAVTAVPAAGGKFDDSFSFKASSSGGLVNPGTITITAPAGTTLPNGAHIHNTTTNQTAFHGGTLSNGNATLEVDVGGTGIGAGDSVTVTLLGVTNLPAGPGQFDVFTSSDTVPVTTPLPGSPPDPDPGSGSGTDPGTQPPFVPPPGPFVPPPVEEVPPPVVGLTASVAPEKGQVLIKVPGSDRYVPLSDAASIPVGSVLDTRKGQVSLTTAANAKGELQVGHFSEGQFRVQQSAKNPLTTLTMVGSGLNACKTKLPKGGAAKQAVAARSRRRSLFSSVHGRFRTRGRNSSATVRGTKWRMTDTCTGTTTKVTEGSVLVRDLTLRRNKLVKAGHSYLARAPLRKRKRRR